MALYEELYIRTQYAGKDYMSVEDIYYYDDDGEELVCKEAELKSNLVYVGFEAGG